MSFWKLMALLTLINAFLVCAICHADDYFTYCAQHPVHKVLHVGISATCTFGLDSLNNDRWLDTGFVMIMGGMKEASDWSEGQPFWYGIGDLGFDFIGTQLGIVSKDLIIGPGTITFEF